MEEALNGYVTNPNPTPTLTLTSTLTLTLTELIKKSKKKRLYKIDRAVCWMEKSANRTIYHLVLFSLRNPESNMRIYFVLCFAALVPLTQTQLGLAGPPGPPGKRGPTGSKRVRIPYCPVSSKITDFLKQFRSIGLKGASGKKGSAGLRFNSGQSCLAVSHKVHIYTDENDVDGSNTLR